MLQETEVRELVRRVVYRTLGLGDKPAERASAITEDVVAAVPAGGTLRVSPQTIVTPLAREAAAARGVSIVPVEVEPGAALVSVPVTSRLLALGADHGGLALKETLKAYLQELNYQVIDCGTYSPDSVDYPDFALAVAELVASGRAWRGIVVDGAGIGSCMAANKVPGVRAAMCYDQATAFNSREHNDANVLTLGGGLIGPNLAKQIVKTWLETEFGGGRHARRVNKIVQIERRFLKHGT